MHKYRLVLIVKDYMTIDGEFKRVEAKLPLTFENYDDVQNVLGYLIDGTDKEIGFTLKREEIEINE